MHIFSEVQKLVVCYRQFRKEVSTCLHIYIYIIVATIPWTIKATNTGRNLVCYVNRTIAIYWSMSYTGHNPHCYNPVSYLGHYLHWAWSCLLCQADNSNLLINVLYKTQSQFVCFNETIITLNTVIKAEFLYQLMYLRFKCYKLKLIDVITISTLLSLSHG